MSEKELKKQVAELEARLRRLEGKSATYVGVAQDKSGSMMGREAATISGYNEYIQELQRKAKNDNMDYRITLTQFDSTTTTLYENRPLDRVPKLTDDTYRIGGMTALLDAVGQIVRKIEGQMKPTDSALILVMTDGHENSSVEFTNSAIAKLIKEKEASDRWTFVYLGADQDAWGAGTSLGFQGGNTFAYTNDWHGITGTYRGLASATHAHATSGGQSMSSFSATIDPQPNPDELKDDEDGDGVGVK